MKYSQKNLKQTKPKSPINIRDPEFRQQREKTKKERLNKQREREANEEIREYGKIEET